MTTESATTPDGPGRPPTIDGLRHTLAMAAGIDPADITPDANLVHLGLGSLEMMRLVTQWHRGGVLVEFSDLAAAPTVAGWHRHLAAAWPRETGHAGKGQA